MDETRARGRHRRRGGDPPGRARRAGLLAERHRGALQHQRGRPGALGSRRSTTTPTPRRPDKTYSKIGGWVRDWEWDPLGVASPDPAQGRRRDGRRAEVGDRLHARGAADYGWPDAARHRAHRCHLRQRDGRRTPLPDLAAASLSRSSLGSLASAPAFPALPPSVRTAILRELHARSGRTASGDDRGHDAGRARQHHRRPGRQPVQLPRAELRRRRGVRLGPGGDGRRDRGAVEREFDACVTGGIDRNMGASDLREVQQDRRALGDRDPARTTRAPTGS